MSVKNIKQADFQGKYDLYLDSHLQLVSVGIVHRVLLLLYLKVTCFVYISADQWDGSVDSEVMFPEGASIVLGRSETFYQISAI